MKVLEMTMLYREQVPNPSCPTFGNCCWTCYNFRRWSMIQNQLQGSKRSATQREPRPKIKRTLELNRKLKARPTKFKTETWMNLTSFQYWIGKHLCTRHRKRRSLLNILQPSISYNVKTATRVEAKPLKEKLSKILIALCTKFGCFSVSSLVRFNLLWWDVSSDETCRLIEFFGGFHALGSCNWIPGGDQGFSCSATEERSCKELWKRVL